MSKWHSWVWGRWASHWDRREKRTRKTHYLDRERKRLCAKNTKIFFCSNSAIGPPECRRQRHRLSYGLRAARPRRTFSSGLGRSVSNDSKNGFHTYTPPTTPTAVAKKMAVHDKFLCLVKYLRIVSTPRRWGQRRPWRRETAQLTRSIVEDSAIACCCDNGHEMCW